MPKQVQTINDFSGGVKTSSDPRDLVGNELAQCDNLDPRGKGLLTTVSIFQDYGGTVADTGAVTAPGYGMFVFHNDYKISAPTTEYAHGEYICKSDGASDGDVDIYETGSGWHDQKIASFDCGRPAFYSAEGDLYVGGENTSGTMKTPQSLMYHKQTRWRKSDGTAAQSWGEKDVANFVVHPSQLKAAPVTGNMDLTEVVVLGTSNAPSPVAGKLHWLIAPSVIADSGTWNNTHGGGADDSGDYYEYYGTFLYKNKTESKAYFLGQSGGATNLITTKTTILNKGLYVTAWFGTDTGSFTLAADKQIYGARLYVRLNNDSDYYLLAEVDYDKGIKASAHDNWSNWTTDVSGWGQSGTSGLKATTAMVIAPPSVTTWALMNYDHPQEELDTDQIVLFRTAVVANSRAYIGNVSFNGRIMGDRILKSPYLQFDRFFENSFIDVALNDGESITALQAYADRLLIFKESTLHILNISEHDEQLEDVKSNAGVKFQAAVCKTPFGIAWVNKNGCYLYTGEEVRQLQMAKISDEDWNSNIQDTAVIGYNELNQQIIIMRTTDDSDSSHKGKAYVYSITTDSWSEVTDIVGTGNDLSNIAAGKDYKLFVAGGGASNRINKLDPRASGTDNSTITLITPDIHFGNYESKKNLCKVSIAYKNGGACSVYARAEQTSGWTTLSGNLTDTSGNLQIKEYDLIGTAAFQGKKTFQVKVSGTVHGDFELEDISLTYRELGIH
jgi:hypothetical protein